MKIINIRGSHGSGKSWVVRQVMSQRSTSPVTEMRPDGKKIEGYLWPDLFVVGKYIDGISTGGADTFKDIEDIEELVLRRAASAVNVLFEGIRVTNGHDRWIQAAWKNKQHDWHFLILNTTVEQSMINIQARLDAAGKTPRPNVLATVQDTWSRCQRQRDHFCRAGLKMDYLSSVAAVERCLELLSQ
jgi:hypothetical protein